MRIKFIPVLMGLLCSLSTLAQEEVTSYKYVIVPKQLDFVKKPDQYQTSSLTKFFFEKLGYTVFFDTDKLPEEISNNRCKSLVANIKDNSGLFKTRSVVELRDCQNRVLYKSAEGMSRHKDYKMAYNEAIRKAFRSMKEVKYNPNSTVALAKPAESVTVAVAKEVMPETKEKEQLNKAKPANSYELNQTDFGYVVKDPQGNVVYRLLKTSRADLFLLNSKKGMVYKEGVLWFVEYYDSTGKLKKSHLPIKL
ncbi:hypothetical protein [Tenacibaculum litopenaei]|uniref:hypothetical protein n=1 Tax=Tenacibaculum litopenaei TaxID=396016 RepID=UPI0038B612C9